MKPLQQVGVTLHQTESLNTTPPNVLFFDRKWSISAFTHVTDSASNRNAGRALVIKESRATSVRVLHRFLYSRENNIHTVGDTHISYIWTTRPLSDSNIKPKRPQWQCTISYNSCGQEANKIKTKYFWQTQIDWTQDCNYGYGMNDKRHCSYLEVKEEIYLWTNDLNSICAKQEPGRK